MFLTLSCNASLIKLMEYKQTHKQFSGSDNSIESNTTGTTQKIKDA